MDVITAGRIDADVARGIARVVIDNPGRKNALNVAMWDELHHVCTSLTYEPDVRAVVITGSGGVFSAGADITEFQDERRTPDQAAAYSDRCQAATDAILALPVPVIAEVRDPCLGAGAAIALAADLRYLAEDARVGIPAAKLGLAFENRWLSRMIETLGVPRSAELLFTARAFDSASALSMGFAHTVLSVEALAEHVAELASGIAALAPLTLRAAKAGLRAATRDDAQAGAQAEALVLTCAKSHDYQRALTAFANKERPEFRGN